MGPAMRHLADPRGSTFLEVVVAGGIFAFLVLALSPSILNSHRAAALSGNSAIASTLALDKLEELRSLLPTAADLAAGAHVDAGNPMQSDGTAGGIFNRSWEVTDDTPETGMKLVEMTVSWQNQLGQSAVTLVTVQMP